jgi:eukaryotic-like serine/threonine-protein kinase
MGEVWLADQTAPVRRQVAIKVIKAGMDSAQVIARFEAERQALALMDHPFIATVYDGGTTPEQRPFFAMEYVKGEPITTYCNRHRLSIKERLQLFAQVCEGVQHAHQKGIIHRDLKASNVLVTIQDDKLVPKIIDFGVAKATAQQLTERSLFTELGVLIGTPEYMSPEQAEMGSLDIDTRTDIYSLGVLLYELLTGSLPFDHKDLRRASIAEIQRIIRQEEPPRPSTRVGQQGPATVEAARDRQSDPRRLASELRGDLDWITTRSLEKDRTRRYQTANALAADVRRHLNDEPVLARAPTARYRAQKFVRRHRGAVAAVSAVILALVLGLVAASVGLLRARRAEQVATREAAGAKAVSDFLVKLFEVADPTEGRSRAITAQEILARGAKEIDGALAAQPEVQARVMVTLGKVYTGLGLYKDAEPLLVRGLESYRGVMGKDSPETLLALNALADVYWFENRLKDAEPLYLQLVESRRRVLGPEARDTLHAQYDLASLYGMQKRDAEMEALSQRTLEAQRRLFGPDDSDTMATMGNLGVVYHRQGRFQEAARINEAVLESNRRLLGADHPKTLVILHNLAGTYQDMGRLDEAEKLYRDVIELRRRVIGESHPRTITSMRMLGSLYVGSKRFDEAETLLLSAHSSAARAMGEHDAIAQRVVKELAKLYDAWGRPKEANAWRAKLEPATVTPAPK